MSAPIPTAGSVDARRLAVIWLILCGVTVLSWCIGIERTMSNRRTASVIILIIVMTKVRLVIRFFMNVRKAPRVLQAACDVWVLLLGKAMIGLYWMGKT